jgi:hypothetical protein
MREITKRRANKYNDLDLRKAGFAVNWANAALCRAGSSALRSTGVAAANSMW